MIDNPLWLARTATMGEARQAIRRHNATSFLIEEAQGSQGSRGSSRTATCRSRRLRRAAGLGFMTPRQRLVTRPPSVSLEEAEQAMFERRVEKLPLVDEQGRL